MTDTPDTPQRPAVPTAASLQCHDCGYPMRGVPGVGRALICPECGCFNSTDAELHAKFRGDYGVADAFRGVNRRILLITTLTALAMIAWSIVVRYWPVGIAGTALIAGAGIVRWRCPRWFVPER